MQNLVSRSKVWGTGQQNAPKKIMDKKDFRLYLISASIIVASIIISKAIISSSNNTCFNIVYEELYKKSKDKNKALIAAAAKNVCR